MPDIDGDGDRDLTVTNQGSDDVTVLRNNGSANFNALLSSPEGVGGRPLGQPATADFDGDGDTDLAVSNADDDNISILRNAGGGNFTQPATSPESVGDNPRRQVAADLDGDGDPDLAVANQNGSSVTILRNR